MRVVREGDVPAVPADAAKFAGEVWQAEILSRVRDNGLRSLQFVYAPGARSNWHVHTGEQALIVVAGRGLIQWEGLDEPLSLRPGDWVHISPGVAHWHGAAPDNIFAHLALTASGGTEWGEPVERG